MNISNVIEECKKINKEYNYFNVINEDVKKEGDGRLKDSCFC